jgi:hypothetical protein
MPARLVRFGWGGFEEVEELADFVAALGYVPHGGGPVDCVAVAASDARAFDVAGLCEVGDDPLRGSFGDTDCGGDVPKPHFWVAGDAEQHLRVAGDERPWLLIRWT